jgi:hypothetical protein
MHVPRGLVGAVRQHMLDASDVEKLRERQVAQYNIRIGAALVRQSLIA